MRGDWCDRPSQLSSFRISVKWNKMLAYLPGMTISAVKQTMYCPRCAKKFDSGTAFCRSCGLSLDGVVAIVSGEKENETLIKSVPDRDLVRYGIGTVILATVIGLGHGALKDFHLYPESVGKFVVLAILMIGIVLIGAGILFPKKKYVNQTQPRAGEESDDQTTFPTANLHVLPTADRSIDDIAFPSSASAREPNSVTENTTRQLR
jgi:hypothetical protein